MSAHPKVVESLKCFRKVRIQMPERDGLRESRELVNRIQKQCNFPLCYVQRLGTNPELIIWRFRDNAHAMEGFQVSNYAC